MIKRRKLPMILGLLMITCALAGCASDNSKPQWDQLDDAKLYNTSVPSASNTAEEALPEQTESETVSAAAARQSEKSWTIDGLDYSLYANGELVIQGDDLTVRLAQTEKLAKDLSSIKIITFGDGVTSISADACRGMTNVTTLRFGTSVRSIGKNAFEGCSSLQTVDWGSVKEIASYAFSGCSSLTQLPFPTTLKEIGDNAFSKCSGLQSVVIGSQEIEMGNDVFEGCENFTNLTIEGNVPDSAFSGCVGLKTVNIGNIAVSIGKNAFNKCTSLENVRFQGAVVTSIDNSAFSGCSALKSIKLPDSLLSIGKYTFSGCGEMLELTIPEQVVLIDDYAFESCGKLSTILFAGTERKLEIGRYAFSGCGLTDIRLNGCVKEVGDHAFDGCSKLTSAVIGEDVSISNNSSIFANCGELKNLSVDLPIIPSSSFKEISNLNTLTLGKHVTVIGDSAFSDCKSLQNLLIPATVEKIGHFSFQNCQALSSVEVYAKEIASNSFDGCSGITLLAIDMPVVPDSAFKGLTNVKMIRFGDQVKAIGTSAFEDCTALGLPDLNSITKIGDNAFRNCTGMYGLLTIGGQIESVGSNAFSGCTSITGLEIHTSTIPDSAFKGMSGVSSLTLGKEVQTIGAYTFDGCSLNSITIPDTVDRVGVGAFQNNTLLKEAVIGRKINLAEDVFKDCGLTKLVIDTDIPDRAFRNLSGLVDLTLKGQVKKIGQYAFEGTGLTSLVLPETVENVDKYAFSKCASLDSLTVLARSFDSTSFSECDGLIKLIINTEKIPSFAFRNRAGINSLTLRDGVKTIGESAFEGCTGLTKLNLNQVTSLGKHAFRQCSNLAGALTIGSQVKKMDERVFEGCSKVNRLTIGVQNIPEYGFVGMTGITTLTFQEGVKVIGKHAFDGDSNINGAVKLPNTLQRIQERAFKGCTSISSLSLPKGIQKIETFAFENCTQTTLKYRGSKAEWNRAAKNFSETWWRGWSSRKPQIDETSRPALKTEK